MITLPKGKREGVMGLKRVLAILDGEEAYVSRLLRYWNSQEGIGIAAAAFTSEESLYRYMAHQEIGLLLCEAGIYRSMEHPPDCKTVLLSGQGFVKESDGLPVIFKFQSAQEIVEEILGYYQELQANFPKAAIGYGFIVYTICSPVGGSGVSSLAFAIAKKKSKYGRVLFLTLDPFYQPEVPGSDNEALTRAIYYIKQKSVGLREKLNRDIIKSERVDCLYGISHWADISECTRKEMAELVQEAAEGGRYDFVIVDAGEFTDAAAGCMEISEKVIMISEREKQASGKEKEFLRQACFQDSTFLDRLARVHKEAKEAMLERAMEYMKD